jgi:hypothetical protein
MAFSMSYNYTNLTYVQYFFIGQYPFIKMQKVCVNFTMFCLTRRAYLVN